MSDSLISFTYNENQPQRLDKYLADCLPKYSRARIQQWIREGRVEVRGQPAQKTGQPLETGAQIVVHIPPIAPATLQPEAIPLEICFENDDLLVVDKAAGMVVHPAAGHATGTLVHAALAHAPQMEGVGGVQRPGVVHRLDKETSGLILLAKNDRAHRWLQKQFRDRSVEKAYLALVDGHPPTATGRVEAAIGRDPAQRKKMAVLPEHKGRPAISVYSTRRRYPNHALLEVHPLTGRTHQIRVHMAFLGCPIVGDTVYGRRKPTLPLNRHFLHAYRLQIVLPGETAPRTFEAPLPPELQQALETLAD